MNVSGSQVIMGNNKHWLVSPEECLSALGVRARPTEKGSHIALSLDRLWMETT